MGSGRHWLDLVVMPRVCSQWWACRDIWPAGRPWAGAPSINPPIIAPSPPQSTQTINPLPRSSVTSWPPSCPACPPHVLPGRLSVTTVVLLCPPHSALSFKCLVNVAGGPVAGYHVTNPRQDHSFPLVSSIHFLLLWAWLRFISVWITLMLNIFLRGHTEWNSMK